MTILQFSSQKSNAYFQDMVGHLLALADAEVGGDAEFGVLESICLRLANEVVREGLGRRLNEAAAQLPERVRVDGVLYTHHQPGDVIVHSLVGPIPWRRSTYRAAGVRNGPTVVPAELKAGIVRSMTPAMAQSVALGIALGTSRELDKTLRADFREPPSRATLERLGQRLGSDIQSRLELSDTDARAITELPPEVRSLSIGLDRTTAPMAEPISKSKGRKRRRPRVRRQPVPVEVNFRMPYIGTVALHDQYGDQVAHFSYFASANDGPVAVVKRMIADLVWARTDRPNLPIVVVQDGAPELWKAIALGLQQEPTIHTWHEVVDRYHFDEKLAKAATKMTRTAKQARALTASWKYLLDTDDDAVDIIEQQLISDPASSKKRLHEAITYIANARDRFRYAACLKQSLPTASGITEAACKSVVMQRAKRSGQRWSVSGLQNVMALRTQLLSDRLPTAVESLRKNQYTAHVANAA